MNHDNLEAESKNILVLRITTPQKITFHQDIGHWELGIGNWALGIKILGIGNGALGMGHQEET
ncbi:hypothetical protein [Nostoc sp. FACHB-133]|uniref:hypothetical protein n=1 Tax=Nostoc sp. FACHB-133 TaxID=2692835 RepID=UPI001681FE1C|nr:hypothetical protein [Nostoc sp. FACHB-133]